MITTNRSAAAERPLSAAQLRTSVAPGLAQSKRVSGSPSDIHLEEKVDSRAVQDSEGLSFWKKALLGTMAGVAGVSAIAPAAQAAPTQSLVTQTNSSTDGLEVMVVPSNLPRVDLLRKTYPRYDRNDDQKEPYSNVGVHLGGGLFHDTNGNLALIPSLAAGWNDGITDFKQVEASVPMGYDDTITRFGNTVHFKDSPYSRHVFVELSNRTEVHHKDDVSTYEILSDGVQFRAEEGLLWRVTQSPGGSVLVDGPGDQDVTLNYSTHGIDVRGKGIRNQVHHDSGRMAVRGSGTDYDVTRTGNGTFTEVDGGFLNKSTIIRDGDHIRVEGTFSDRTIVVDPQETVGRNELTFQELTRRIEEAEPGYAAKHPLVMAVLEYAVANPGLVGEGQDTEAIIRTGSRIAAGGGALTSGTALVMGAQALSLAENAQALGAAALASKAAAQAAAQAGNLSQAASFAAEAQGFADQARSVGSEAMRLGEKAQNTAQVARVMTGVAGALQVIDGGMDLHRGASNKSVVEGAMVITESMREMLSEQMTGAELEQSMEDYSKVMKILRDLEKNANKQMTVGGLKIGCGGLMLISALAGGAVIPPIIGAVGLACTVGTAAYEHWDELEAFFNGKPMPEDPSLKQVLPDPLQNEIIIRMD